MQQITRPIEPSKAASRQKAHRDFPLGRHARVYWCKKVRGKIHYFGGVFTEATERRSARMSNDECLINDEGRRPVIGFSPRFYVVFFPDI